MSESPSLFADAPDEVMEIVEAARRVAFAFNGKFAKQAYSGVWGDFHPQHESLLALDLALRKAEGDE